MIDILLDEKNIDNLEVSKLKAAARKAASLIKSDNDYQTVLAELTREVIPAAAVSQVPADKKEESSA
jgi:hypothetical protein